MNAGSKQDLRRAILCVLDRNRSHYGQGTVAICFGLREFAFTVANFKNVDEYGEELAAALQYLTDKKLVEEARKEISAEVRAWRITTGGIAFLDQ